MDTAEKNPITIETTINAPIEKVWDFWSNPEHIIKWSFASDEWHAPAAENDLRVDGKFNTTMAAKDGSVSFSFGGTYTTVQDKELIEYVLDDDRKVKIAFTNLAGSTKLEETFDPDSSHPAEIQKAGWQSILNNFKKYTEEN